uniref:Uncharacterized AAA domain-containing protein ycf46 n=1 Tax=Chondria tumulosa TaxID=2740715 RepID=A0A896SU08_9FLOR|nr:hypothetical protein K8K75_pgp196 [Chondria tumulosa]QSD57011.1 hypothetical protein [Chondria tumulosa]
MNFEKEITVLLSSNNFIIYIETKEEERLEFILKKISKKVFRKKIYSWNFIDGYNNSPNYTENGEKNPLRALEIVSRNQNNNIKIFFLKEFYQFINDLSINRKLKNTYEILKKQNQYIIINGIDKTIPNTLKEYITCIKLPLPNKKEIKQEVERFINSSNSKYHNLKEYICNAYTGCTINKIRKSISELIIHDLSETKISEHITKEKEKFIEQEEILKFSYNNKYMIDIGGLINLKSWLKIRQPAFKKIANVYGIKKPRGIILVGIQGTGKSLSAKAISMEWNLPLLKLDISKGFAGILGESESRIKKIIEICESISPCILWIDEIDKIFTQNININDSGTTTRVTNIFLTWLSEKNKNVFVIATANNINNLPVEMLRKGRFDEIFFVDLPNLKERIKIFKIHLKKIRPLTWYKYNIYYLSKISKKFSGAEIEQSIIEGMYKGFYNKREFNTQDIATSIKEMIPLAKSEEQKILKLREWGYSGKIKIA